MAVIQCNFFSKSLMRTVPIQVVLPTDKMVFPGQPQPEERPLKTLYLLHGVFGNYTDWLSGTRLQSWAEARDLCVVMPSGDNSFYVDNVKSGNLYSTFVGQELVDFTRRSFPLSRKREDTFIGGLSMGGFGATVNGLRFHETFSHIVALSAAYIIDTIPENYKEYTDNVFTNRGYIEAIFGDPEKVKGSEFDYDVLAQQAAAAGDKPRFFIACGTEDQLIHPSRAFRDRLQGLGYDVTWQEGPGRHDWAFWDEYILKALDWLPLHDASQGISSGNISE